MIRSELLSTTRRVRYYDGDTAETIIELAANKFDDTFAGAALAGAWSASSFTIGTGGLCALLKGAEGGVVQVQNDAMAEEQARVLSFNDFLMFGLDRGVTFEAVVTMQTQPTLLSEAYWGLTGNYVKAAVGCPFRVVFVQDGAANLKLSTDDGTTDSGLIDTGVLLVAGVEHVFRIDATRPTNVKFYMDGEVLAPSTVFTIPAIPAQVLQPLFGCYKASGAGVGEIRVGQVQGYSD